MRFQSNRVWVSTMVVAVVLASSACASLSNKEKGAVIGAAAGGAAGGVIALSGGLTYAEMASMYPRSGGVYVYLREAFGPMLAFLYGWAALLIFFSGGIAAVAVGFADYLSYFAPSLSPSR